MPIADPIDVLQAARVAHRRHDWAAAREGFDRARRQVALGAEDTALRADAAWWLGDVDEAITGLRDAFHLHLADRDPRSAAMTALAIGYYLALRGDEVGASGWVTRCAELLADQPPCAEHGYAAHLDVEAALARHDHEAARDAADHVGEIGHRFDDRTLIALSSVGRGRALLRLGQVTDGMALLDAAMVAATSDDLDPGWAGNIYCHLMAACHELADLRRAAEWTAATQHWCEELPAAVLFAGICRVHRAQVLHARGSWDQAEREAQRVCQELTGISVATAAEGHYQVGEVRRARGDLEEAEAAYRRAHRMGRSPHPGLALLRLAQGQPAVAAASIRAALAAEPSDRLSRAPLLAAQVEIALVDGDVDQARAASDELAGTAQVYATPGLRASAAHAAGAVRLAEDQPAQALPHLQHACRTWHDLGAAHDAARARVLLSRAYRALRSPEDAALELDAAEATFTRLGARADLEGITALRRPHRAPGGLTPREVEVLELVAAGGTNRDIADALVISEKTVARHLSNIFTKLGISSRTAAAAFAHRHGLTGARG